MPAIPVLRRPRQEDHPTALHSEFEDNLDCIARLCLRNKRKKKREGEEDYERRGREGKREGRKREKAGGKGSESPLLTLHLINTSRGRRKGGRERKGASQGGEEENRLHKSCILVGNISNSYLLV